MIIAPNRDDNKIDFAIKALQTTLSDINALCLKAVTINGAPSSEIRERVSVSIYGYNYQVKNLGNIKNWGPKEIGPFLKQARKQNRPILDKNGDAKPEFQTCMRLAFVEAKRDIEQWLAKQNTSEIPSPIVINITDGYPYEGEGQNEDEVFSRTLRAAKELTDIRTSDGPVRLFNIHYEPSSNIPTLRFPKTEPNDRILQFLYHASSPVTAEMAKALSPYFPEVMEGARAMISNEKDAENLTSFISTSSTQGMATLKPESDVR
jgi:hypothetical protein